MAATLHVVVAGIAAFVEEFFQEEFVKEEEDVVEEFLIRATKSLSHRRFCGNGSTKLFVCGLEKGRELRTKGRHYSGLFQTFCSLLQNA